MARRSRYSTEVRERFVRLVREHGPEYPSQWAAITSIASKAGCTAETLRKWVRQGERDAGVRGGLTTDERLRLLSTNSLSEDPGTIHSRRTPARWLSA